MIGVAYAAARVIERRSDNVISARLMAENIDWVTVNANGLQVHLTGTAPNEAARFRAVNLVGSVVDASRVRDALEVTPASAIAAPRFSVEMLRNDDGIQLIGLMPEDPGEGGIGEVQLADEATALSPGTEITNMLEAAAYPAPETWNEALAFGINALKRLNRSKISVSADRVEITAISDSDSEKRRLEADLRQIAPQGVTLVLNISAPRPVITPFTLRFIIDAEGARFDSCSADTDRARDMILAAAATGGVTGRPLCTVGLGVPTPRWADAVTTAIRAVTTLGEGSITFSDADVTLLAGSSVSQATFDRVVGELETGLPDVFSLTSTLEQKAAASQGPAEFTASLAGDGKVELRGRLTDEMQRTAVDAFARAAFGSDAVYTATRLDTALPDGWPVRVLAGLEALAELEEGSLLVRADLVEVTGVTGSQQARSRITQILSGQLGQGQTFRVNVRYDEALDPIASIPTPEECAADVNSVIARTKITFTPASAEIASTARPVLDALAAILVSCPPMQMEIGGYTDSQGSEGGNQALSQARAEAVLVALQGRRIDISGMTAVGYGEASPIADNQTDAGREANRRIEFVLKGAVATAAVTTPTDTTAEGGTAPADAAPAPAGGPASEPDFSGDTSPSVAPTEKTIRPLPRPATAAAQEDP
jgi:OmpA-OmpF porin, OOP family